MAMASTLEIHNVKAIYKMNLTLGTKIYLDFCDP